jgi:hypothetical protein
MKVQRVMGAIGVCSLLLLARAASAAPAVHATPAALASAKKAHATAKADRKAHGSKRAPQHDAQLDYPQLG